MALYIYSIASSVAHVVLREEIERSIADRNARIAALETEYLAKTGTITEYEAVSRGFVKIYDKKFITRENSLVSASQ